MKKLLPILLLQLLGCMDSDGSYLRATFGSRDFSSTLTASAYNGSLLVINGLSDSGSVSIMLAPVTAAGSYAMQSEDTLYGGSQVHYYFGAQSYHSFDGSGSVTINSINSHRTSGTLTGRLVNANVSTDTIFVSHGEFNITIDSSDPS